MLRGTNLEILLGEFRFTDFDFSYDIVIFAEVPKIPVYLRSRLRFMKLLSSLTKKNNLFSPVTVQ